MDERIDISSRFGDRANGVRTYITPGEKPREGASEEDNDVGRAWLDVSVEYLARALMLPDGCKILGTQSGDNGVVALLVESPDIHPEAMRVSAVFTRGTDGAMFHSWKVTAKRDPSRGDGGGGC